MTIIDTKGKRPCDVFKQLGKRPEREANMVYTFPGMSPVQIAAALNKGMSRKALSEQCHARKAEKQDKPETTEQKAPEAETATTSTVREDNGKECIVGRITGFGRKEK